MDVGEIGKILHEQLKPATRLESGTLSTDVESIRFRYSEISIAEADSESTVIDTRNSGLEGATHPVSDVPFERDIIEKPDGTAVEGVFPVFDPVAEVQLEPGENGGYENTRLGHEEQANSQLREQINNTPELRAKFTQEQLEQIEHNDTPDGYTWHHHQEPGKIQLVDERIHAATGHTGGYSIWGQ